MKPPTPPTAARPRIIGYARVSTTEQADRGVSLAVQRERLQAYATALGLELVRVEEDAGLSGALPPTRRPGLWRALEALSAGEAAGLVVLRLDRLSRRIRDTLDLLDGAQRRGWRMLSVSEALDTGSAAGRMVVAVLAALAQMEREQIGERVDAAHARILQEGRARSRFLPFGWRVEGSDAVEVRAGDRGRLVPHQAEQLVLRRILALRARGGAALRIATALNAAGVVNPRSGRAWTRASVRSILATASRRAGGLTEAAPSASSRRR